MFKFLKKLFETPQKPFVVVNRKRKITVNGQLYRVIYKDTPKEVTFKQGCFTFWEQVVSFSDHTDINMYTGKVDLWSDDSFTLKEHYVSKLDIASFMRGREFFIDDLDVVTPLKNVFLFEPNFDEELSKIVEVVDTILIPRLEIIDGDVIVG